MVGFGSFYRSVIMHFDFSFITACIRAEALQLKGLKLLGVNRCIRKGLFLESPGIAYVSVYACMGSFIGNCIETNERVLCHQST